MRQLKLIGLLLGVIIINIVVLSPGLLGVSVRSDSVFEKSVALTLLIISGIVVIYASFRFLYTKPQANILLREPEYEEMNFEEALLHYRHHRLFPVEVDLALDQVNRMKVKKSALLDLLRQRFQPNELSYNRFLGVITDVEQFFNRNIQGLLNKLRGSEISSLSAVDQRQQRMFSQRVMQQKHQLHQEYTTYVQGYVSSNEEILIKLDQLLLETTLLSSSDFRELEEMPCMQEIELLIKQTKFYKH